MSTTGAGSILQADASDHTGAEERTMSTPELSVLVVERGLSLVGRHDITTRDAAAATAILAMNTESVTFALGHWIQKQSGRAPSWPWLSITPSGTLLGHQGQRVALGVLEERHPQLVVGHARDEVRCVDEVHAALLERGMRLVDVVHAEVQDRAGMIEVRVLGQGEHESHAPAV